MKANASPGKKKKKKKANANSGKKKRRRISNTNPKKSQKVVKNYECGFLCVFNYNIDIEL